MGLLATLLWRRLKSTPVGATLEGEVQLYLTDY